MQNLLIKIRTRLERKYQLKMNYFTLLIKEKRTHPYHQQQTDEPIEHEDPYYPEENYYRSTQHKYCDK